MLGRLELGLRSVRTDVERREALAAATPSIWPTVGWLSVRVRAPAGSVHRATAASIPASTSPPTRGARSCATADGTVESAEWNGNYGNLLVIDHGFGIKTRYGHLAGSR